VLFLPRWFEESLQCCINLAVATDTPVDLEIWKLIHTLPVT